MPARTLGIFALAALAPLALARGAALSNTNAADLDAFAFAIGNRLTR